MNTVTGNKVYYTNI